MEDSKPYQVHGYPNRRAYLIGIAEEHGVSPETVFALAKALGPAEDFDMLVSHLEDIADAEDFPSDI